MPILGLLLDRSLANNMSHAAHWIGVALLVAAGLFATVQAICSWHRQQDQAGAVPAGQRTGRLLVTGAVLSIDNLAVGFALGTFHVNVAVAAVVTAVVAVAMSLVGLELGDRLGAKTSERGELLGGLVLIGVGIAVASGVL